MAERIARLATTGIVEQGGSRIRFTKEAIESIADQLNGERALPSILEHDPSYMPLEKVIEGWTESLGSEYVAMARVYVDEDAQGLIHAKSGTDLVRLNFAGAPKAFYRAQSNDERGPLAIRVDRANFADAENHAAFVAAVDRIDGQAVCGELGRHSLVPEPVIEFLVSDMPIKMAVGMWIFRRAEKFIRYAVDETLKRTADAAVEVLSAKISGIVKAYGERQMKDDRRVLVKVVIPGDMDVILLTRMQGTEKYPRAWLEDLTVEMEKYGDILQQAEEAVFCRMEGKWEFQYLKTCTGEVVGTRECYNKTIERARNVGRASTTNGDGSVERTGQR